MFNCTRLINLKLNKNLKKLNYLSTSVKKNKIEKLNPFSQTVLLPETKYLLIESESDYEKSILDSGLIDDLYFKQNSRNEVKEFILLDGPPYANGDLHVGHAINKTLKDIFCRYYVNRGFKVNFRLGWDCHGLPIELKAIKDQQLDSISIRERSKKFALNTIQNQSNGFRRYGVQANFADPYVTCKDDYVTNQINAFFKLYAKNLIKKKFYPIYWSPSSKSALAEAELEYNDQHPGYSCYFKFKVNKAILESRLETQFEKQLNVLVWTTTPWTIPSNRAISYSKKLDYAIVELNSSSSKCDGELFILNSKSIETLENKLDCKLNVIQRFNGDQLSDLTYEHALKANSKQPFIECDFIDENKGTGLVHNSPNHGHDDYLLFTSNNLQIETSLVDENGCFNELIEQYLTSKAIGLSIFKEGSDFVLEFMKDSIVKSNSYLHSYPYDWRTKQPVFTTVKNQFFMNIESIKEQCLEAIDQVNFIPQAFANRLKTNIVKRTEWCISRQRVWGVPIPAFYSSEDKERLKPIVNVNLISHLNQLILERGASCWWKNDLKDFLPDCLLSKAQLPGTFKDYCKETDILDVWFDSGIAFDYVLKQQQIKQADLILEGQDQLRGWFLSSLILSVALQNGVAPFKNVFVHGFAMDKDFKKMSKSLGNVIDPKEIVDGKLNCGADAFRLWVSKYANSHINAATNLDQFETSKENLQKWRKIFRFAIANLSDGFSLANLVSYKRMNCLDQHMLFKLYNYDKQMEHSYESFDLNTIYEETNSFLNAISSNYFLSIKNRLYNEECDHQARRSIQTTLYFLVKVIEQNLSPIIPFFFINFKKYHPIKEEQKDLIDYFNCPTEWNDLRVKTEFELLNQIKECLNKYQITVTVSPQFKLIIFPKNDSTKDSLSRIESNENLSQELNDILLVQSIEFEMNAQFETKFNVNELDRLYELDVNLDTKDKSIKNKFKKNLVIKKNDKVPKYIDTDSFILVLQRSECKRCLRCRLFVCDKDQTKPICLKCNDYLLKNYPQLIN